MKCVNLSKAVAMTLALCRGKAGYFFSLREALQ